MKRFAYFFLLLILAGCNTSSTRSELSRTLQTTTFSGTAMTMVYKVIIGAPLDSEQIALVDGLIAEAFHQTDTLLNKWNPDSELSSINKLPAHSPVVLSPLLLRLFTETDTIVRLSGGRFDPTIEPLQTLWKIKLSKGTVPTAEEIATLSPMIGWDKIVIANGKLVKNHPGTQLDFGGIAKGLCIDLMCDAFTEAGFNDFFVEWGGEIRAGGTHPEGRPWIIFIARLNDTDPEHAVATVELNNQAIATSGDYLQNWSLHEEKNKTTYFHIFDPVEMRPLSVKNGSVASASVLAKSCAFADGLATAAMMFPSVDETQQWADNIMQQYPELQFWIVTRP